jgi:hypothetical protein
MMLRLGLLVMVAGSITAWLWMRQRAAHVTSSAPAHEDEQELEMQSERPLLVDIDGDGQGELIFRAPAQERDGEQLVAMTTPGHAELWRVPLDEERGALALAGKTLLWGGERDIVAHDLRDGARRWSIRLPDRIDLLNMQVNDRHLWLRCSDRTQHLVALADGTRSAGPSEASEDMQPPRLDRQSWHSFARDFYQAWPGLRLITSACRDSARRRQEVCDDPVGVGVAVKEPGTEVPFLVGFDRASQQLRWKVALLDEQSLDTAQDYRLEAFGPDRVYLYYSTSILPGSGWLRAISTADGKTLWAVNLSDAHHRPDGILATPQRVYVRFTFTEVLVLDAATGEEL